MLLKIQRQNRYILYLVFCLIFSMSMEISNFIKNKKIIKYDIIYNVSALNNHIEFIDVSNLKMIASIFKNHKINVLNIAEESVGFKPLNKNELNEFLDNKVLLIAPFDYTESRIISIITKEFKKNIHKNLKKFIEKEIYNEKVKKNLFADINQNFNVGYLINTNLGEIKNQIVVKTFHPNLIDRFLNEFAIEIQNSILIDWQSKFNQSISTRVKKEFLKKIQDTIFLLQSKNVSMPFETENIFKENSSNEEILKICKFLDTNLMENNGSLLETCNYLIDNIEIGYKTKPSKIFFDIEKISEKKFIDIYKIWSQIILAIFFCLVVELIYIRKKK